MGMFREIFIETLKGTAIEKFLGVLFWLLSLTFIVCVLVLLDSSLASTSKQMVKVSSKEFVAAHTTFVTQIVGKSTMLTPIHNPDSWYVTVSNSGELSRCRVDEITFHKSFAGDAGYAYVGGGFFSEQEYCDKFEMIAK